MNNFIKKNISIIISIFILIQPVLDLLTGLCLHVFNINLTIGIIIRILFLLFIVYISLFVYKHKKLLIPYLIMFIYSILYILGIVLFKNSLGLFTEVQGLIKVLYFPTILISLYSLRKEITISKLTLLSTLFLYLIFIFIPTLFGLGFKTYEITKVGTLGFFNSANEISGVISILTPILFIILLSSKKIIPKIILLLIYLVVILMMGTKTPFLSLGIVIGMSIIYLWFNCFNNKQFKPIIYSFISIIIGILLVILILPRTNFYKNIETELDFIEVDNPTEVFTSSKLIDHAIFGQRLTFFKNRLDTYNKSNTYEHLFGIGYLVNGKDTKQVEMDYFDIFINHGIIGLIVFMSIFLYVLTKVIQEHKIINYENYMLLTSIILIILLSLVTGHIIVAPSVSFLSSTIIILLLKKDKESIIIAIGNNNDIEEKLKSLKNIDYDKYKVTVLATTNNIKVSNNINIKIIQPSISNYKNTIKILIFKLFNYKVYDHSICNGYDYKSIYVSFMKDASFDSKIYIEKQDFSEDEFNIDKLLDYKTIIVDDNNTKNKLIKKYSILKDKISIE